VEYSKVIIIIFIIIIIINNDDNDNKYFFFFFFKVNCLKKTVVNLFLSKYIAIYNYLFNNI